MASGSIELENIGTEIAIGGIDPLLPQYGFQLSRPLWKRLVPDDANELYKIGTKGMSNRVVIVGIIKRRISKRTHKIYFSLQVQVFGLKCIDVFTSQLQAKFVSPPPISCTHFFQYKFI